MCCESRLFVGVLFLNDCYVLVGSVRVWVTEPHEELPIKIGTEGASAAPPKTVFDVFKKCVEEHGEKTALKFQKVSEVNEGTFVGNVPGIFP